MKRKSNLRHIISLIKLSHDFFFFHSSSWIILLISFFTRSTSSFAFARVLQFIHSINFSIIAHISLVYLCTLRNAKRRKGGGEKKKKAIKKWAQRVGGIKKNWKIFIAIGKRLKLDALLHIFTITTSFDASHGLHERVKLASASMFSSIVVIFFSPILCTFATCTNPIVIIIARALYETITTVQLNSIDQTLFASLGTTKSVIYVKSSSPHRGAVCRRLARVWKNDFSFSCALSTNSRVWVW